jgi:hypothetical protein
MQGHTGFRVVSESLDTTVVVHQRRHIGKVDHEEICSQFDGLTLSCWRFRPLFDLDLRYVQALHTQIKGCFVANWFHLAQNKGKQKLVNTAQALV